MTVIPANAGIQKIIMPQAEASPKATPRRTDPPVAEILDSLAELGQAHFHGNDRIEKSCQENKKMPDNSISGNPLMKYVG